MHVELSPNPVPTIDFMDQTVDWFASVDRCFGWNDRLEQLGMQAADIETANSVSTLRRSRDDEGDDRSNGDVRRISGNTKTSNGSFDLADVSSSNGTEYSYASKEESSHPSDPRRGDSRSNSLSAERKIQNGRKSLQDQSKEEESQGGYTESSVVMSSQHSKTMNGY